MSVNTAVRLGLARTREERNRRRKNKNKKMKINNGELGETRKYPHQSLFTFNWPEVLPTPIPLAAIIYGSNKEEKAAESGLRSKIVVLSISLVLVNNAVTKKKNTPNNFNPARASPN